MPKSLLRRSLILCATSSVLVSSCASISNVTSSIVSPGPPFSEESQPTKIYVVIHLFSLQDRTNDAFRRSFQRELHSQLAASGVDSVHVWQTYSADIRRAIGDPQRVSVHTSAVHPSNKYVSTFKPTHILTCESTIDSLPQISDNMYLEWRLLDARNRYLLWSVFTRTTNMSQEMPNADSDLAAQSLAKVLATELRDRKVVRNVA